VYCHETGSTSSNLERDLGKRKKLREVRKKKKSTPVGAVSERLVLIVNSGNRGITRWTGNNIQSTARKRFTQEANSNDLEKETRGERGCNKRKSEKLSSKGTTKTSDDGRRKEDARQRNVRCYLTAAERVGGRDP